MNAISTAVGTERLSRVSGYQINKGNFNESIENLPQQILILAEGNTANQNTFNVNPVEITSAKQAGYLYGFGSPIYQIMRILRPNSGDGVGAIPTVVIPQKAPAGATATVINWSILGPATKSGTHYLLVNGRTSLDAKNYAVNIVKGDTATDIALKYANAVNGVLGSPFTATADAGAFTLTTKWKGLTAAAASAFIVYDGGDLLGLTYSLVTTTAGTGTPDLADAFTKIEDTWYTMVINSYGVPQLSVLEEFNGRPDATPPTGRYATSVFKPFIALFGSTEVDVLALKAISDNPLRVPQCTNVLCPAPNSVAMPFEAAANAAVLFAVTMQNTPHLDISGLTYPDMPPYLPAGTFTASNLIGKMAEYNNRDLLVKVGCSTVTLVKGLFEVQDFVTTYHPEDESPLQFSYARNLNLDWNVKDAYTTLEKIFVRGHVIVPDNQVTSASKVIKPSEWKAKVYELIDDLADKSLLKDADFSKSTVNVQIDPNNPNRFNTTFSMKRTGVALIESTTVTVGF